MLAVNSSGPRMDDPKNLIKKIKTILKDLTIFSPVRHQLHVYYSLQTSCSSKNVNKQQVNKEKLLQY